MHKGVSCASRLRPTRVRLLARTCRPSLLSLRASSASAMPKAAKSGDDKTAVMWFRKGLRLHDNPALLAAAEGASALYPVFCVDHKAHGCGPATMGVNRAKFLIETLEDLDKSLRARGSRLIVLRGEPTEVLPRAMKDWGATDLCYEQDLEPYSKERDAKVDAACKSMGVAVHCKVSHTLYDVEEVVRKNKGKAPLTMTAFTKIVDAMPAPKPAPDPPSKLPPVPSGAKHTGDKESKIPDLKALGHEQPPAGPETPFKGGETAALARLAASMSDPKWVCAFEKPKTDPSAFLEPATTVLSPYLCNGSLSPRLFHAKLVQIYKEAKGKHSAPPVSLRGQLLWRDFYTCVGVHTPNYDKMEGNPICIQIPWDKDEAAEKRFKAWQEAQTGYPWIDAIMTQLKEWGWMHHLARHSVACFLTRGDLYVSWERGRDHFDALLIDSDWSLNSGNWMWLSASSFFYQYFRVYSPVGFGKKYDPSGKFVRKFLPVLKDVPDKYIYEPWKMPRDVQQKANCVIGKDYPKPIVDHDDARKECISRMAAAYKARKEGASAGSGGGAAGKKRAAPAKGKAAAGGKKKKKAKEESESEESDVSLTDSD
ncbi:unnamed protein product [Pedinophyceae sp. YPF-701]|nr:unnamed protein product [Pedinophyceae sp. YPF-701]